MLLDGETSTRNYEKIDPIAQRFLSISYNYSLHEGDAKLVKSSPNKTFWFKLKFKFEHMRIKLDEPIIP